MNNRELAVGASQYSIYAENHLGGVNRNLVGFTGRPPLTGTVYDGTLEKCKILYERVS